MISRSMYLPVKFFDSFKIWHGGHGNHGLPSLSIPPPCVAPRPFRRGRREPSKWNESGFRPPLCTYRLNWTRRTSWRSWDDWDDTVLQTQDSKFEPWRSEAENATSRSRRLPTILTLTRGWGRNILFLSNRRDREPSPELWRERQRC